MKKIINSQNAPAAIGPYSQAVEANGMIYVSGQLPIDVKTGKFVEVESGNRRNRHSKISAKSLKQPVVLTRMS